MKLFPENVHYFIFLYDDLTFKIGDGADYFSLLEDNIHIDFGKNHEIHFKLDTQYIITNCQTKKLYLSYDHSSTSKYIYYLSDSITHAVTFEIEDFDRQHLEQGSYSRIYDAFDGNENLVTKVYFDKNQVFTIPNSLHSSFSPYCVISESSEIRGNIFIETMKKGIRQRKFKNHFQTPESFFVAFRNLWEGIKVMKDNNFVHGDISFSNIVIVDNIFKFIDFNLSFMADNPRKTVIFTHLNYTIPFPISLAIMASPTNLGKFPSKIKYTHSISNSVKIYNNILDVPLRNIILSYVNPKKVKKMFSRSVGYAQYFSKKNLYDYISVYQLCVTFVLLSNYLGFYAALSDEIFNFSLKCLNLNNNTLFTAEQALELYDSLIISSFSKKRKIISEAPLTNDSTLEPTTA